MAWLLKIETDSILIKEKRKHFSKLIKRKRLKFGLRESSHRSIYQYTKFIRYRISYISLNQNTAASRVKNSGQVSSCQLKFVHPHVDLLFSKIS